MSAGPTFLAICTGCQHWDEQNKFCIFYKAKVESWTPSNCEFIELTVRNPPIKVLAANPIVIQRPDINPDGGL